MLSGSCHLPGRTGQVTIAYRWKSLGWYQAVHVLRLHLAIMVACSEKLVQTRENECLGLGFADIWQAPYHCAHPWVSQIRQSKTCSASGFSFCPSDVTHQLAVYHVLKMQ